MVAIVPVAFVVSKCILGSSALLLAGHDQSICGENFTVYQICLVRSVNSIINDMLKTIKKTLFIFN